MALEIKSIDAAIMSSAGWLGYENWKLIGQLRKGQMIDITPDIAGRTVHNARAVLAYGIKVRKLIGVQAVIRGDNVYAVRWGDRSHR